MKLHRFGSRWAPLVAVALGTALVVSVAGASSTPTPNQYTGCLNNGTISSVKIGTAPLKSCVKPATQITWSQTGPAGMNGSNGTPGAKGDPGTSVTSASEPAGSNCADGGSSFTSVSGTTYACNGAKGGKGDTGATGPSSLDALRGSPCTVNGLPSTLAVSTDNTSGVVTMTCTPVTAASACAAQGGTFGTGPDLSDSGIFGRTIIFTCNGRTNPVFQNDPLIFTFCPSGANNGAYNSIMAFFGNNPIDRANLTCGGFPN